MSDANISTGGRNRQTITGRTVRFLALLSVLIGAYPAFAMSPDQEIARCIARAAAGRDWLEKTLWGLRDQEGGWIGAEVANANGTHDLGPLQINSWWVPRISAVIRQPEQDVRAWLTYDACFNADVARWIFLSALRSTGDYWVAVGVYHSPTAWRQLRYATSVADHLTRRFGPAIFSDRFGRGARAPGGAGRLSTGMVDKATTGGRMFGFGVVAISEAPLR